MKKIIFLLFVSQLMISCFNVDKIKDQIESQPEQPSFAGINVPADFEWSIYRDISVTVSVADAYNGMYNYGVHIYDVIPSSGVELGDSTENVDLSDFVPMQFLLLNRGLATGSSPFTCKITIPSNRTQIAIAQITPTQDTSYVFVQLDSLRDVVDYKFGGQAMNQNANAAPRKAGQPAFTVPSNHIDLVPNMNLQSGKIYHIPAGVTISHLQNWPNDFTIYVEGELKFQQPANMNTKARFYVMGSTDFTQAEPRGRITAMRDVHFNKNVEVYNYGYLDFPNAFTMTGDNSNKVIIENHYKIDAGSITMFKNTEFKNYGRVEYDTDESFKMYHNAELITYPHSDIVGGDFFMYEEETKIEMKESSMIDIDGSFRANKGAEVEGCDDGDDDLPVIRMTEYLHAHGDAEFEEELILDVDPRKMTGTADFDDVVIGNPGWRVSLIPIGPFNYTGYNVKGDEPEDGNNGGLVFYDNVYTVAFEDNYPEVGDMDLNDVVIDWKIGTRMNDNNKVTEVVLRTAVKAVGASKQIAGAIKVKNLPNIASVTLSKEPAGGFTQYFTVANGLETGVDETVIPIFESISKLFGMEPAALAEAGYVNVQYKDLNGKPLTKYDPYEFDVTIKLSTPTDNAIVSSMFDFFIVTSGSKLSRQEIHKFGGVATSKANNVILFTNNKTVWGVELGDGFKYPLEYQPVNKAYRQFQRWVETGGKQNKNWYKHPQKQYVY